MKEDIYITFEDYLSNQMSEEVKKKFEEQLALDPEMSNKLQVYVRWTEFLEGNFSKETTDFKNNLSRIAKQHSSGTINSNKSKVIPFNSKWFAIAATIVVFISIWFFTQNGTPEYTDYNQHERAYFTERSEGDIHLKAAQEAFNNQDYENAIVNFQQVSNENFGEEAQLFYGVALIETNQFEKAEVILEPIQGGDSVYKEKAIWYLGLSKLKQKKFEECKMTLETLPKEAEDYDKAQEIIRNL